MEFRVRFLDRIITWLVILIGPIVGCLMMWWLVDNSSELYEQILTIVLIVIFIIGIISAGFCYFRFRGSLNSKYIITSDGLLLNERGDWGMKTDLSKIVRLWSDINAVRINDAGKVRVIFKEGDQVESLWRVDAPEKFEQAVRNHLEASRQQT